MQKYVCDYRFRRPRSTTIFMRALQSNVSINEEPYAGKPQVRFCEGNKSSHNLLGENYMTTRQNMVLQKTLALGILVIASYAQAEENFVE